MVATPAELDRVRASRLTYILPSNAAAWRDATLIEEAAKLLAEERERTLVDVLAVLEGQSFISEAKAKVRSLMRPKEKADGSADRS